MQLSAHERWSETFGSAGSTSLGVALEISESCVQEEVVIVGSRA